MQRPEATRKTEEGGLTVMIPAYNEAESIADTIRSLRQQTIVPDEIVVIDDCSTDATAEVASTLGPSGCFSIYRTEELGRLGGWSTRTMAEDMDLTWTIYASGRKVRFFPAAVSYPIEPHDFAFLGKQLRRWSHGPAPARPASRPPPAAAAPEATGPPATGGPPEDSPAPDHAGPPQHDVPPGQARRPLRGLGPEGR